MSEHGKRQHIADGYRVCAWFLLCDNIAVTTRKHPILGDVPICQRCDEKVKRLGG